MTRTHERTNAPDRASGISRWERAAVLGAFALVALMTVASAVLGFGPEPVAAAWIAASVWAFVASLVFALRSVFQRKLRNPDHRKVRTVGGPCPDDTELIDWSTQSGAWLDMAVAEENERWMRGG
ncbi:MAG: hypothetical protein OXO52_11845 [Rhodospirillales bacterium]|nr:hypothetical protein [Rhodospirillales bacterium]